MVGEHRIPDARRAFGVNRHPPPVPDVDAPIQHWSSLHEGSLSYPQSQSSFPSTILFPHMGSPGGLKHNGPLTLMSALMYALLQLENWNEIYII